MAIGISCTFLINGDKYDLIGMAGGDLVSPEQFGTQPTELHSAHHATYELTPEALYLRALTLREGNVHYLPIGGIETGKTVCQNTYQGLNVTIPFTGKMRLAKDFNEKPYINTGYQKALAYKTVLDVAFQDGRITEVMDRSWEMEQKRDAFKKCYESARRLENMGYRKAIAFKTILGITTHDGRRSVDLNDRSGEMEHKRCALKEYDESAKRLEKILYAFSLDVDLE